jgi:hypothetical protein
MLVRRATDHFGPTAADAEQTRTNVSKASIIFLTFTFFGVSRCTENFA